MTKNKKDGGNLGRSLIRKRDRRLAVSGRHTTEEATGTSVSVTENTSVEEFLSNAAAAQRTFNAERGQMRIVQHQDNLDDIHEDDDEDDDDEGLSEEDEDNDGRGAKVDEDEDFVFSSVPKKPDWRTVVTKEEYRQLEQTEFLRWKRHLAKLQATRPNLPPFEKNLDFWRQLWKIVEMSDVVVQVVDARDPLFFHSQDLSDYVKEVGEWKQSVILLNKADFLTFEQRSIWSAYFKESDMKTLFFSAMEDETPEHQENPKPNPDEEELCFNRPQILSPREVLQTLQAQSNASPLTVGFLGYPNVGKSSTINRFLTNTRLQVSATPGKTKHYQTHVLKGEVILVDGPGLVIPNLNMTKADMVLAGILPIDNLTDYLTSVDLLMTKLPFHYIQKHYGIMPFSVREAKKHERKSESMQILSAYGLMRGFMKPGGVPDQARAARVMLKDYVLGKLLYCQAPPTMAREEYQPALAEARVNVIDEYELSIVDSFPELTVSAGFHVRGVKAGAKKERKRKEKIRRIHKDPFNIHG